MRFDPGTLHLLHDEPPAGAGLDRERRRRPVDGGLQPAAQQHPVRGGDSTPTGLAAALIEIVEGDLPPVNVQSAYDPHRGPPQAPTADAPNGAPELRGSLRMSSFWPARWPHRPPRETSRSRPARRAGPAPPGAAAATARPRSRRRTAGARSPWTPRTPPADAARHSRWSARRRSR